MLKIYKKYNIRIGILGGTFDPPHKGHVYISKVALKKLRLKKVIWAITKKNPLKKKPYLNLNQRKYLAKKILKNEKKIFIKYYDDKIKSSNTFELLKHIKKDKKKVQIFFLMGADNLIKLHNWKNWTKISNFAKIAVFPRKNYLLKKRTFKAVKKLRKKDLIFIKSKKVNISSSLIRKFW